MSKELKAKGGHNKIVLSDKDIEKIERMAGTMPIEKIAYIIGFSEDTFHELKKRDHQLLRAYKRG